MIVELLSSAFGTVAFSVLFGVPREYYLPCGLIGAAGWLMYSLMLLLGLGTTSAVFLATVVIVLLSRFAAVYRKCPATVFLITGIFPLVPGAQIYWSAYYLVTNQLADFQNSGFSALKSIFAIVLGIIVVFELPHRIFRWKPR